MEYKYKDKTFTLKTDNLKLMRVVFPLIESYRKLRFEALSGIDRKIILVYEKKMNVLKLSIARGEERKEDVSKLQKELDDMQYEYDTDSQVNLITNHINELLNGVLIKLSLDDELMKKTIPELLEGDFHGIDYSEDEFNAVIVRFLADFFFVMREDNNM